MSSDSECFRDPLSGALLTATIPFLCVSWGFEWRLRLRSECSTVFGSSAQSSLLTRIRNDKSASDSPVSAPEISV